MRKALITALLVLGCVTVWGPGPRGQGTAPPEQGQPRAADVAATVDGTIGVRQATQQEADAWATERAELVQRWRAAQDQIARLSQRRRLVAGRLRGLEDRVTELERRLAESARLEAGLQDTLVVLLARLESWVASDLPFLPDERGLRLEHLRNELVRPEVEPSEKLRRLLEALQIEAQYGTTTEVYQDRIRVEGDSLFVDVLRLGRLSLFWRTPDGTRVGEYDRVNREWVDLPTEHRRSIGLAMEMAERRRPVELIALPLGRIRP